MALEKDPDLQRVSFNKTAEALTLIGIAKFNLDIYPFSECKRLLKKALGMAQNSKITAIILHNLAVMNYYEINYHNDRIVGGQDLDEKYKKIAIAENLAKRTKHAEADDKGNLRLK